MDYTELETIYKFATANDIDVMKHGVVNPGKEILEQLRDKYKIKSEIKQYIQVLSDGHTVSKVLKIGGNITFFERVTDKSDAWKISPYEEYDEEA